MFFEIYQDLCRKKGLSVNAVAKALSISSGAVSEWKKGRTPHNSTLKKIADYFGVSVDFLLDRTNVQEEENEPFDSRSASSLPLVALYGGDADVTPEMWEEVQSYARAIQQRYQQQEKKTARPPKENEPSEDKKRAELAKRLTRLNEEELARVDAFVQGLLANRSE